MKTRLTALFLTGMILSCTNNKNEEPVAPRAEVKLINSPASDSCAEPSTPFTS